MSNSKDNSVYRWVSVKDRLPGKQHNYHVRIAYQLDSLNGVWNTASLWNGEYWEHPTAYESWSGKPEKANVIEWLEKVEEDQQEWQEVEREFTMEVFKDVINVPDFVTYLKSKYHLIKK